MEAYLVELAAYCGIVDISVGGDRDGGCEGGQEMLHGDGRYAHACCGRVSSSWRLFTARSGNDGYYYCIPNT